MAILQSFNSSIDHKQLLFIDVILQAGGSPHAGEPPACKTGHGSSITVNNVLPDFPDHQTRLMVLKFT